MAAPIAILDGFRFPFNPNAVSWGYNLNTASYDTLGGRVTQILSANITTMSWQGEAGSRDGLLAIANKVAGVMLKQVQDGNTVRLDVPLRGWVLDVYCKSMPGLGFDLTTVVYPYQLTLEIQEDYGTVGKGVIGNELAKLGAGIGYSDRYHGGTKEDIQSFVSGGGVPVAPPDASGPTGDSGPATPDKPADPTTATGDPTKLDKNTDYVVIDGKLYPPGTTSGQ